MAKPAPSPGAGNGDLEVVDIDGVEIFAAGGPYHGQGSPPEGDHYTREQVEEYASNTEKALAAGRKSVVKIGHNAAQKLAKTLGLAGDELPALGVQTNFRVDDEGKVLADWKSVPKKLAAQIKAKRWPSRSVEIHMANLDGEKVPIFGATALLGAMPPAVGTLADIAALHAQEIELARAFALEATPSAEVQEFASGDLVWQPEQGFRYVQDKLSAALNPGPGMPTFCVDDVTADGDGGYQALVSNWSGGDRQCWIVPFSLDGDTATAAPSADWTEVEQAWVEMSLADPPAGIAGASDEGADTSPEVPDQPTSSALTDEQIESFATGFGISEDDPAKRRELVLAKFAEHAPAAEDEETPPAPEPDTPPSPTPPAPPAEPPAVAMSGPEVEVLKAKAERGDKAYAEMRQQRIDNAIVTAMREGRLDPAKEDTWRGYFDENDELATKMLAELPVNEDFVRTYGNDDDGSAGDSQAEESMYRQYAGILGGAAIEMPVTYNPRGEH